MSAGLAAGTHEIPVGESERQQQGIEVVVRTGESEGRQRGIEVVVRMQESECQRRTTAWVEAIA